MPAAGFSHVTPTREDLIAIFESKFIPEPMSGCWLWTGNLMVPARGGYAIFTCRPAGLIAARAHRLSWEFYRGPIPDEAHVLHHCDMPPCVNPEHLFLGDQIANMADKVSKSRQNRGETHGMVKLTERQVLAIRSDARLQRIIAEEYGVTIATVSDVQRRRSWRYLE